MITWKRLNRHVTVSHDGLWRVETEHLVRGHKPRVFLAYTGDNPWRLQMRGLGAAMRYARNRTPAPAAA